MPYSILIQKSEGSSAFDEQKVKNIAIEYRLQSIFPNPGLGLDWGFRVLCRSLRCLVHEFEVLRCVSVLCGV